MNKDSFVIEISNELQSNKVKEPIKSAMLLFPMSDYFQDMSMGLMYISMNMT